MGTNLCVFEECERIPNYISDTWCIGVWKYLNNMNAEVRIKDIQSYEFQHEGDFRLMDCFMEFPELCTTSCLRQMNACHMFLRCEFLRDIVSLGGHKIRKNYWDMNIVETNDSIQRWPDIGSPDAWAWRSWRYTLTKSFTIEDRDILNKLGRWKTHHEPGGFGTCGI